MSYNRKNINKVYIILSPPNIKKGLDIMTPIKRVYHHDFYENIYQSKNKNLCFICNHPRNSHINSIPGDSDEAFDNIINNNNIIIIMLDYSSDDNIRRECYEEVEEDQKKFNSLPCGHLCYNQCWVNYLKSKISEAKVEQIKCVEYKCNQILPEEFILKLIKEDNILLEKYEKFKLRAEIIKDPNKRQCPKPNCGNFCKNQKINMLNVNGHKFCFECLRPWHGEDSCEKSLEKEFLNWKKIKI